MHYVYSTCANSGTYCDYGNLTSDDKNRGHHVAIKKVTIMGGNGVARQQKSSGFGGIYTPKGVVTEVSDEDMEFLLKNECFKRHVAAGHISYDKRKMEPEKKIKDMNPRDGSAPISSASFDESENSTSDSRIYKKKE